MSEHAEQVAFIEWTEWKKFEYPDLEYLYAVPNGGKRHPATAAKMKAEGVKAGVPDLCLPTPRGAYHGLYLETKYGKNTLSKEQKKYLEYLKAQGYCVKVCYGQDELKAAVLIYLNL